MDEWGIFEFVDYSTHWFAPGAALGVDRVEEEEEVGGDLPDHVEEA